MSRTLSTATNSAVQATVTRPGYLVMISAAPVLRLSSRNDQSWNGYTWTGGRIKRVGDLSSGEAGEQQGRLDLVDTDDAITALLLNANLADTEVVIWEFYNDNPAPEDPVEFFRGVIDDCEINEKNGTATVRLVSESSSVAETPRRFINAASGFHHLSPEGKQITWGGQVYTLERER